MIMFWIFIVALIVLALVFMLPPLLRPAPLATAPAQDALNLEVFQQRISELDADLSAGFLDQDQYVAARRDLERDLLHDLDQSPQPPFAKGGLETPPLEKGGLSDSPPLEKGGQGGILRETVLATILGIGIPALALGLYWLLGNPALITQLQLAASTPAATNDQDAPSLDVLAQRLEERLKADPASVDGWLMLGRTYFALENRERGLVAVAKAFALAPTQIEVMLAYAESLVVTSDSSNLAGRPTELINAVLQREPTNATARWLRGVVAYRQGNYQRALEMWQSIAAELEPGGEEAKNLGELIAAAKQRLGEQPAPAPITDVQSTTDAPVAPADAPVTAATAPVSTATVADSAPAPVAADNAAALRVTVALDPTLATQTSPDQAVFIFARAANGPPMPLAAVRLTVKDLPQTVTLDDSSALMPALRLSAFSEVIVGARISASGEAMPQTGDLEGETAPFAANTTAAVAVTIDRVRP
ncbi:c-type cytochrome biogenesis protein CcmI [Chromatium okenii]|uniref:c-type cytochrome biogenesis protein CcmI n=1 Tax=Chromatium okenii TaxID=61644 RepID=UPI0026ED3408|nr:c-type cytochrome biogenesis protein CcmI [Chromatium okenii]MBV5309373.1 c-type cytochrome biogenesis protein CcmI [Chromatium okenii]